MIEVEHLIRAGARRAGILRGMKRKRMLPEALRVESAAKKLMWLYITINGEAEYSARGMGEELGIQQGVCARYLRALVAEGWLERTREPAPAKPGIYRARVQPGTPGLLDPSNLNS